MVHATAVVGCLLASSEVMGFSVGTYQGLNKNVYRREEVVVAMSETAAAADKSASVGKRAVPLNMYRNIGIMVSKIRKLYILIFCDYRHT